MSLLLNIITSYFSGKKNVDIIFVLENKFQNQFIKPRKEKYTPSSENSQIAVDQNSSLDNLPFWITTTHLFSYQMGIKIAVIWNVQPQWVTSTVLL